MKILLMLHFLVMKWVLLIYLNNINLDVTDYEEDDPDTIIFIKLLAWLIKFEKRKALKKGK